MNRQNLALAAINLFAALLFFFTLLILSAGSGYAETSMNCTALTAGVTVNGPHSIKSLN